MPYVIFQKKVGTGATQGGVQGAHFNGVDSYLSRSNTGIVAPSTADAWISVWINTPSIFGFEANNSTGDQRQRVRHHFDSLNGNITYGWWWHSESDWSYRLSGVGGSFQTDEMTHIAFNRGGPSALSREVFINGSSVGTMAEISSILSAETFTPINVELGRLVNYQSTIYYEGTVKNLTFGTGTLSAQNALDIYNAGINGDPTSIVTPTAWYPFQTDFNDYSGNGYHFTTINNVTII